MQQQEQDDGLFAAQRTRLFGVAYRMLGTRADAEDVVQDAWLRWRDAHRAALQSAEAWLVTVTTRLALDRLRARKAEREKMPSFHRMLHGAGRIAGVFWSVEHRFPGRVHYRMARINGEPGLLRYVDGKIESAQSFLIENDRIAAVFIVRNPDKLAGVPPA